MCRTLHRNEPEAARVRVQVEAVRDLPRATNDEYDGLSCISVADEVIEKCGEPNSTEILGTAGEPWNAFHTRPIPVRVV